MEQLCYSPLISSKGFISDLKRKPRSTKSQTVIIKMNFTFISTFK